MRDRAGPPKPLTKGEKKERDPRWIPAWTPGQAVPAPRPFTPPPPIVPRPPKPPPAYVPFVPDSRSRRVLEACPSLIPHPPLVAFAAHRAGLSSTPGDAADAAAETHALVRAALADLRASFLAGHDVPGPTRNGGFSRDALRAALVEDILAGDRGIVGRDASDSAHEAAALSGAFDPEPANPRTGSGDRAQSGCAPAPTRPACVRLLSSFYREGAFAARVASALSGVASALRRSGGVTLGAPRVVDFGLQRVPNDPQQQPSPRSRTSDERSPFASFVKKDRLPFSDPATLRTRVATLRNDGDRACLVLAVSAAPTLTRLARLRCDFPGIVRHPADDAPADEVESAPVAIAPGGALQIAVDVDVGAPEAAGDFALWVLAAFVTCPPG